MGFNVWDFELKYYVLLTRRTGYVIQDVRTKLFVSKSMFSPDQLKKLGILDSDFKKSELMKEFRKLQEKTGKNLGRRRLQKHE